MQTFPLRLPRGLDRQQVQSLNQQVETDVKHIYFQTLSSYDRRHEPFVVEKTPNSIVVDSLPLTLEGELPIHIETRESTTGESATTGESTTTGLDDTDVHIISLSTTKPEVSTKPVNKYSVKDLKSICEKHNISSRGTKDVLIERLREAHLL